ncbi:MAG: ATP-dependent protease ATPase subunit HslU [Eubacteriales bacterium]|nr:ATP-dependent protease ATPase subunit HslU [Eubacteriales bacterium]
MDNLTPIEIVKELDKYIIGQDNAKRSAAIALRNRYRRSRLSGELQDEINPKNILMQGPTGVGKTEIARRLAKIVKAPFVKVEATKFTEVGYVGRDVESMVRDLAEISYQIVKKEKIEKNREKAEVLAEDRLLDLIIPKKKSPFNAIGNIFGQPQSKTVTDPEEDNSYEEKRRIIKEKLKRFELEEEQVEIEIKENGPQVMGMLTNMGMDDMADNMGEMFNQLMPQKKKKRKMKIKDARKILTEEEAENLLDNDEVKEEALRRAENYGIIFIDEIDKIASRNGGNGPDVSREGVQRDILPVVEGSVIRTKYGNLKTDHILFIAAGAFHIAKPEDLIPELQGRFPISVKLNSLTADDFKKILKETKNSLIMQYTEMLKTDKVYIEFSENGIDRIAELAYHANLELENIGARRLQTIMEKLLEDISFEAPYTEDKNIIIDQDFVNGKLDLSKGKNINNFIL